MSSPQIANPHTKYCIVWSQNSRKSCNFNNFLFYTNLNLSIIRYMYGEKVCIADSRKFSRKSLNRPGSSNRRSVKCHFCGRSKILINYLSLQICGFTSCGTACFLHSIAPAQPVVQVLRVPPPGFPLHTNYEYNKRFFRGVQFRTVIISLLCTNLQQVVLYRNHPMMIEFF
jgi:hypothetical protein